MKMILCINTAVLVRALVVCLSIACSQAPQNKPRLIDSNASEERGAELARLRALQAVKGRALKLGCYDSIKYVDDIAECEDECPTGENCEFSCPNPGDANQCKVAQWKEAQDDLFDPNDENLVENVLGLYCRSELQVCFDPSEGDASCDIEACESALLLCEANVALELGAVRTRPTLLPVDFGTGWGSPNNNSGLFEFPPLTVPENAALAEIAMLRARDAAAKALETLHEAAGSSTDSECLVDNIHDPMGPFGEQAVGEVLAQTVKDAYDVYHEAVQRGVELNVGFADKQRGNPNLAAAVRQQQTGPTLSRAHAANLLVGGTHELSGAPLETGLCTTPELTGGGTRALQLLREVGMCPKDIEAIPDEVPASAEVTLQELLYGDGSGSGAPSSGSLRQRLVQQRGLAPNVDFFEAFGVTEEDFGEAREYLSQQLKAFSSSPTQTLPLQVIQNPPSSGEPYPIFAATRTPPSTPDPAFYAGVARSSGGGGWIATNVPNTSATLEELKNATNLMDFEDMVVGLASQVLRAGVPTTAKVASSIKATLGYLVQAGREDVHGRFRLCTSGGNVFASVLGYGPEAGLIVVQGEAGLECATKGTVSGAPCNLSSSEGVPPLVAYRLDQPWSQIGLQSDYAVGAKAQTSVALEGVGGRLYLVAPKSLGVSEPGAYAALASAVALDGSPVGECANTPVTSNAALQAGKILTPSVKWCSHPHLECDGSLFDERIPLEDELSEDSDGFESSWKHYLALAQQASAESDLLAQEYVQAGLDLDRRAEETELREQAQQAAALHELETLQNVCGTNIDPQQILALLGTGQNGTDFQQLQVVPSACDETAPCPTNSGCYGGKCIGGPLWAIAKQQDSDPEMAKLVRCLALNNSVLPAVTLGQKNLCFWRDEDPNVICSSEECAEADRDFDGNCFTKYECPVTVSSDGTCPLTVGPAGQPVEMTADALGYFAPADATPSLTADATAQACDILRQARHDLGSDKIDEIKGLYGAQELFASNRFADIAKRIGFRAKPGTWAELTLDAVPWKNLGSATASEPVTWPCTDDYACSAEYPDALFCQVADCSSSPSRAQIISRLELATQTLSFLAGQDRTNIQLEHHLPYDPASFPPGTAWPVANGAIRSVQALTSHAAAAVDTQQSPWVNTLWYSETTAAPVWTLPDGEPSYALAIGNPIIAVQGGGTCVGSGQAGMMEAAAENEDFTGTKYCESYVYNTFKDADYVLPEVGYVYLSQPGVSDSTKQFRVSKKGILDALEIYCQASEELDSAEFHSCKGNSTAPLKVESVEDLAAVSNRLYCLSDAIKSQAAHALIFNFPEEAIEALTQESRPGTYPALGGEVGQEISGIRAGLVEMSAAGPLIAAQIDGVGFDIEQLRTTIEKLKLDQEIRSLNYDLNDFAAASSCMSGMTGGILSSASDMGLGLIVGAASCVSSAVQMDIVARIQELEAIADKAGKKLAIVDFQSKFLAHTTALGEIANGLIGAQERLDQALSRLQGSRTRGLRALNSAVWLSSQQSSKQFNIDLAIKRRFNTARVRYEEAHGYAKRMAFLARRAIEARLGVRLETIDEPLPLVAAPSGWISDVCATDPIDYQEVGDADVTGLGDTHFANAFIGSYVKKLEAVVESYRLVNNFHEGQDTAVVSLRDDVFNVRTVCDGRSTNLLRDSGDLAKVSSWPVVGCAKDGDGVDLGNCMAVVGLSDSPSNVEGEASVARGQLVTFGPVPNTGSCGATCGLSAATMSAQKVELGPGTYILSWYAKKYPSNSSVSGAASVRVLDPASALVAEDAPSPAADTLPSGWKRHYFRFTIADGMAFDEYSVAVLPQGSGPQQVLLAGLMLSREGSEGGSERYEATNSLGLVPGQACEDSEGREFRSTRWKRDCVLLCRNGFGGDCDPADARSYCYREAAFSVSQQDIEQGGILSRAGVALGNFNYRIESIALNFVGTDLRRCGDSSLPQTCFAAGFVPYSVVHSGPYFVRNHDGESFEVPLFTGNIEHARGLATERYLSNPLSDSDRSLLGDYVREEFQGRPLDGNFAIRVWEDDAVDFGQIQDVQVVLSYRYWTRFD